MQTSIVLGYYSRLVTSRRAPELRFLVAIPKYCVYVLLSFVLFALVGGPDGFSCHSTDVEGIAARGLFLPLPEGVYDFVNYVGRLYVIRMHCQ